MDGGGRVGLGIVRGVMGMIDGVAEGVDIRFNSGFTCCKLDAGEKLAVRCIAMT